MDKKRVSKNQVKAIMAVQRHWYAYQEIFKTKYIKLDNEEALYG